MAHTRRSARARRCVRHVCVAPETTTSKAKKNPRRRQRTCSPPMPCPGTRLPHNTVQTLNLGLRMDDGRKRRSLTGQEAAHHDTHVRPPLATPKPLLPAQPQPPLQPPLHVLPPYQCLTATQAPVVVLCIRVTGGAGGATRQRCRRWPASHRWHVHRGRKQVVAGPRRRRTLARGAPADTPRIPSRPVLARLCQHALARRFVPCVGNRRGSCGSGPRGRRSRGSRATSPRQRAEHGHNGASGAVVLIQIPSEHGCNGCARVARHAVAVPAVVPPTGRRVECQPTTRGSRVRRDAVIARPTPARVAMWRRLHRSGQRPNSGGSQHRLPGRLARHDRDLDAAAVLHFVGNSKQATERDAQSW